jgi:hypothetical protein
MNKTEIIALLVASNALTLCLWYLDHRELSTKLKGFREWWKRGGDVYSLKSFFEGT